VRAVVVGAGLAGIAATWALEQHGYECVLLESSDRIGGRMKTTTLGEHNVDEGFHVLHTAYPTLGRWLDIDRLELKPMDPATSLITPSSGRLQTLGDPLRAPLLMLPSLFTAGLWNSLRMLRWRLKSKKKDLEYAMDRPTLSIDKGFESMRFSPSFRDSFLHPLFTGITLDNERRERTSFASFTWAAMSHGSMTMPKDGIQAVPEQLASQLKKDTIRYNTNVRSVSSSGVTLDNGETMEADLVVVAVPQHIANTWLENPQQILRKQTATFVFEAEQSPLDKPRLLLNREYAQEEQNILHVHVPTLLHPSSKHLIVATVVGEIASEHRKKAVQKSIHEELGQWFGEVASSWKLVGTTHVDYALPSGSVTAKGRERMELVHDGVHYIGDHTIHPSVHGTLRSVERLLERLEIPLPLQSS
jgi:phytoene dehydrogenase-like protein